MNVDPLAIELARQVFAIVKAPLISSVVGKSIEIFEKPLLEAVPLLRHMGAIRLRQLERSIVFLDNRMRQIELTQDGERLLGFANVCFRYFEVGSKEHREVKLKMLAAACAHCASSKNTDSFDLQLEYFDVAERLQPFHVSILQYLDEKYSVTMPDGKHDHPFKGTFKELLSLNIDEANQDLWLTKSLIALRDMSAIYIKDGASNTVNEEGNFVPMVEPYSIVRNGKIALGTFGCRLLRYLRES